MSPEDGFSLRGRYASGISVRNWADEVTEVVSIVDAERTMSLYAIIGEKVVEARSKHGLAQEDLAALIGIKRNRINEIEARGRNRISGMLLQAIACALGVPLQSLLPPLKEVLETTDPSKVSVQEEKIISLATEQEIIYFRTLLGRNIYNIRQDRKLLYKELAEKLYPKQTITIGLLRNLKRIECGTTQPDIFFLILIAYALNATLDEIMPRFNIDRVDGFVKTLDPKDAVAIAHFISSSNHAQLLNAIKNRGVYWAESDEMGDRGWVDRAKFYGGT